METANNRSVFMWRSYLRLVLLLMLPLGARAQFTYETNNGAITIAGYDCARGGGAVTIPSSINGRTVTAIRNSAFYGCTNVSSISIPGTLTQIGDYAFRGCQTLAAINVDSDNPTYSSLNGALFDRLQSILLYCPEGKVGSYSVPNSVIELGGRAFTDCYFLTNIVINNHIGLIKDEQFSECSSLLTVTIGEGVTSIGNSAFSGCTSLRYLIVPNSVVSIGATAFQYCTSLTNLTIGSGVAAIGNTAFYRCYSLKLIQISTLNAHYSSIDGVLYDLSQATLIQYPPGRIGAFMVPSNVSNIGPNAFEACSNLSSLLLPNGLTNVGFAAFAECSGLTGVALPNSICGIGAAAFSRCSSLTNLALPIGISNIAIGTFSACRSLTSITIPSGVTNIGDNAFEQCSSLSQVMIGERVATIGQGAFASCQNLETVIIPNSVTLVGYVAFFGCSRLSKVTIGDHVTSVGAAAFAKCDSLISVVIPQSVTNIGNAAFHNCTSLNGIYFEGNSPVLVPHHSDDGFQGLANSGTCYYLRKSAGWGPLFGGLQTAIWQPIILVDDSSSYVSNNRFGFNISWAGDRSVVVEAATNAGHPVWTPVSTNTLRDGSTHFSDPEWTNYPVRLYRLRTQ